MRRALALCTLVVLSSFPAVCQKLEIISPEKLVAALKSGSSKANSELSTELGFKHFDPNQDFKDCQIRLDYPHLDIQRETSLLQVKCSYDQNIVVLGKSSDGSWERLDTVYLYAAYDRLSLAFASLIRPDLQEIVIHKAATVSGNIYEAHFLVLGLESGYLRVEFSTLESAVEPRIGATPRVQDSTFTVTSATATDPGEIDQNATVTIGKKSYSVARSFSWKEDWHTFISDGVDVIKVRQIAGH